MQIKHGIAVSPGVAISQAVVLDAEDVPVPRRVIARHEVPDELARLDRALELSCTEIEQLRCEAAAALGEEPAKIFDFHLGMLRERKLIERFKRRIEHYQVNAVIRKLCYIILAVPEIDVIQYYLPAVHPITTHLLSL